MIFLNPELTNLCRQACQQSPNIHLSPPPQSWGQAHRTMASFECQRLEPSSSCLHSKQFIDCVISPFPIFGLLYSLFKINHSKVHNNTMTLKEDRLGISGPKSQIQNFLSTNQTPQVENSIPDFTETVQSKCKHTKNIV